MGDKSGIEWTDATWNPVTGCTKVSPGCAHCYAERIMLRFKTGTPFLPGQSTVTIHRDRFDVPLRWKRPRRIFVNSMSDIFHDSVPMGTIITLFDIMHDAKQHVFQVLTKRHERLEEVAQSVPIPRNVWIGVSVENQLWAERRIPELVKVNTPVRFLSCEPLLGSIDLTSFLPDLQWIIAGGESGPKARPCEQDWILGIRDQCAAAGVPFFMKQMSKREAIPDDLMVREFPDE